MLPKNNFTTTPWRIDFFESSGYTCPHLSHHGGDVESRPLKVILSPRRNSDKQGTCHTCKKEAWYVAYYWTVRVLSCEKKLCLGKACREVRRQIAEGSEHITANQRIVFLLP